MTDIILKEPSIIIAPFEKEISDLSEDENSFVSESSRILRYFAKPKESGQIMVAHLKCLKPIGKDYEDLMEIERRRKNGEDLDELIPLTDAEFDWEKVKSFLHERGLVREERFNERVREMRKIGDIRNTVLELNDIGLIKITALKPAEREVAE